MGKMFCFFGWHNWTALLEDYINEFGFIPLDNRVPSNSVCSRCGIKFKKK